MHPPGESPRESFASQSPTLQKSIKGKTRLRNQKLKVRDTTNRHSSDRKKGGGPESNRAEMHGKPSERRKSNTRPLNTRSATADKPSNLKNDQQKIMPWQIPYAKDSLALAKSHRLMPTQRLAGPLRLESGEVLNPVTIAYEIHGVPRADGSNVVVVCHTLTGGLEIVGSKPWWFVGRGQLIDSDDACIISLATLGNWRGSSSPNSHRIQGINQRRLDFPTITVRDSIEAHRQVLKSLGVRRARAVVGGSFGGFCAYTWLALEPEIFDVALIFQSALRCSAHTIGFFELARDLIVSDHRWRGGDYQDDDVMQMDGLKRMLALNRLMQFSHHHFERKFPPEARYREQAQQTHFTEPWSPVDDFVMAQPQALQGLDPADFLCLIRSSALFDLERTCPDLWQRWRRLRTMVVHVPCRQDWRYPVAGMEQIHKRMESLGVASRLLITESDYGHGSFLHDPRSLRPFLPLLNEILISNGHVPG